jgi:hypothetical protein
VEAIVDVERFSVISDSVGFALMKLPAALHAAYERSPSAQSTREGLNALRAAMSRVNPSAYRGIERCPLCEDPIPEPGWATDAAHRVALDQHDVGARIRMLEIVGPSAENDGKSRCIVPTIEYAKELIGLVDSPAEYEIVRLAKALPGSACFETTDLGFDVGYWGSDSYSIICDSAIWPMWHGPHGEIFGELAKRLTSLNSHCLFPSYQDAERFRSWYLTQDWAEQEGLPGEFCIIKLES